MHRSGHMQVETVFQPRELDLNGPDFAEGHRSYEQCVAEAHRIASPRARSEDEAREVLESVKSRFYAAHANKIAENQDELAGRGKRKGKKHRYDAYTAKVFGKTGKSWADFAASAVHKNGRRSMEGSATKMAED